MSYQLLAQYYYFFLNSYFHFFNVVRKQQAAVNRKRFEIMTKPKNFTQCQKNNFM